MTDDKIKYMVDRFLGWRLPENFSPDAGISFTPTFNEHLPIPMKHEPVGTNLFDASQAEQMVRYMVDGMPPSGRPESSRGSVAFRRKDAADIARDVASYLDSWQGKNFERIVDEMTDVIAKTVARAGRRRSGMTDDPQRGRAGFAERRSVGQLYS